jgi:hypothetical protein
MSWQKSPPIFADFLLMQTDILKGDPIAEKLLSSSVPKKSLVPRATTILNFPPVKIPIRDDLLHQPKTQIYYLKDLSMSENRVGGVMLNVLASSAQIVV